MNLEIIITIVTMIVTFLCGELSKKYHWFNTKLIPIQNLAIGLISAIIYYIVTKDIDLVILLCGLATGGSYDIGKNLRELFNKEKTNIDYEVE